MYIFIINMITNEFIKSLKIIKFKSFKFIIRMLTELKEII